MTAIFDPLHTRILESLPDGVVACDGEGKLNFFNQVLRDWHGLPPENIPVEHWSRHYSLLRDDGVTPFTQEEIPLRRAFKGETLVRVPMVIAVPGRELRHCEASGGPFRDEAGKITGAFVVMHDVTSLVRSRNLLQQSIESSIAGFDIVSHEGKFIYANRAYLSMWGYESLAEILGDSPADHCADPDVPRRIITALKTTGECVIEFLAKRKDGSTFDVLMSSRLDFDELGNEIYPTFSMDLTEIKRAIRSRDEFLSMASHELLTPLTSLKLQTQALQRKHKDLSPELIRYMENSLRFIGRLNRLIDDMLDISRIVGGKFQLQIAEVDFGVLLPRKLQEFQTRFPEEDISLKTEVLPKVLADGMRLEQVIENLVSNAVRYAPKSPIQIELRQDEKEFVLSVTDEGPGIPAEEQERIFERFERVGERIVGGLGLGLSIVKEIVQLHGWKIDVRSSPGEGATFSVRIPNL